MTDPSQLSDAQLDAAIAQAQAAQPPAASDAAPQPTYAAGTPNAGQQITPAQGSYYQTSPPTGQGATGQSAANPSYDTPTNAGANSTYHVTTAGGLSVPAGQAGGSINLSGMSDADLDSAITAAQQPKLTPLQDIAAQVPTGMAQGVSGLVGLPGDFLNAAGWLGDKAGQGAAALSGRPWVASKSNPRTILPGVTLPDSQDVNNWMQSAAGEKYPDAQTLPGQYARTLASFAPAALAPAGGLTRAASVVVPALASETAGQLTKGTPLEPWARLAGGLVGGLGVGTGAAILKSPEQVVASAARAATPQVLDRADQLMETGRLTGQPLTRAEAIDSASGGATTLNRTVRSVESVARGKSALAPFYAVRPDQVKTAIGRFADSIAPPTIAPGMLGQGVQEAASTALNRARQTVNAAASPHYDALRFQEMDPDQYGQLAANPSYAGALNSLRSDPELGADIASMPDHNLSVVNEVVKHLDTLGSQAAGTPMAPGDMNLARLRSGARGLASDLASDASDGGGAPGQGPWSQARSTVANLSQQYVDPLKAGPLGTMSASPDLASQVGALYPALPTEGAAVETGQAARVLNAANPSFVPQLTRSHVVDLANRAAARLQNGLPNTNIGPNFAKLIAGNSEQEAALKAGVGALPNAADNLSDLQNMLDVHRAMGTRLAEGSPTAEKLADAASMKRTPLGGILKTNIAEPGEGIAHLLESIAARRHVDKLAQWLQDQGSVKNTPTAPLPTFPWLVGAPASQQLRLQLRPAGG